jgi:hypothetical protein
MGGRQEKGRGRQGESEVGGRQEREGTLGEAEIVEVGEEEGY